MKKRTIVLGTLMAGLTLTSFSVSGTYAKYASKVGTATDTAKVAKWFKSDPQEVTLNVFDASTFVTKKTVNGKDLIAPGTYGVLKLSLSDGILTEITTAKEVPEVAYEIVPTITVTDGTSGKIHFWIDDQSGASSDEASKTVYYQGKGDSHELADLQTAISDALKTKVDATGAVKASEGEKYLHWSWAFGIEDDVSNAQNQADTTLGATAGAGTPASVTLKMDLTATQINPTEDLNS